MKNTVSDYEMYLYLSYLPKFAEVSLEWLNCDFDSGFGEGVDDETWWVDEGVKALKQTMADEIASTDANATHIVPLSGGLDSRAILGGLLENLPKSQIVTATYGIPGAWDFEIAKSIARKYGIRHEVFNLLDEKWDLDQLTAAATRLRSPISVYQSYVRQKINNHFGTDCIYWSGWLGGSLTGHIVPENTNLDRRIAVKKLVNIEPTPNYKDQVFQDALVDKIFLECPWDRLERPKFTLDQQLYFGIRQRQLTMPIVIINGFTFKIPFLNKKWVDFMLSVPYKWLFDQNLYIKIIQKSFKGLSDLGTTATAGMPLFRSSKVEILLGKVIARVKPYIAPGDPYHSHPRTNYINWAESLRHKGSLQDTVYTTLQDLKKRALLDEHDMDTWWQDHLSRKTDRTVLLMNLSSLELLLKAGIMA